MSERRKQLEYEVVRRYRRGESKRGIARALGIDRKTVRGILKTVAKRRANGDDVMEREGLRTRTPRRSKLDPYKDDIAELIREFPDIRATRLLEELQARGFDGQYTIVRRYLRSIRPKPKKKMFRQVQTGPGKQAQADWSPYKLSDGTPIYALSVILSYSRYQFMQFVTDMRQPTLFRLLKAALEAFGGVPEELVFDSMPGVVDRWEMDIPMLNLRMVDFAAYHGFGLHIAPRGDGAYKGKVERPFRFLEESFFNARRFDSLEAANRLLAWWLEHKCNARTHKTTRRQPCEMLAEELSLLHPLPTHPYDDRELAYRLVDGYGRVGYDGNFYSAPESHVGCWVYLRVGAEQLDIFDETATLLASHHRQARGLGLDERLPEHRKATQPVPFDVIFARFAQWGQGALVFAHAIRQHKRCARPELAAILALQSTYKVKDILAAIDHASRYRAFDAQSLSRILQTKSQPRTFQDILSEASTERIRQSMYDNPVNQRPLSGYPMLRNSTQTEELNDKEEDT